MGLQYSSPVEQTSSVNHSSRSYHTFRIRKIKDSVKKDELEKWLNSLPHAISSDEVKKNTVIVSLERRTDGAGKVATATFRILLYGYDSHIGGSISTASINDYANRMLILLNEARGGSQVVILSVLRLHGLDWYNAYLNLGMETTAYLRLSLPGRPCGQKCKYRYQCQFTEYHLLIEDRH